MGVRDYGTAAIGPDPKHIDTPRTSSAGDLLDTSQPKLLGTLDPNTLTRRPSFDEDGPPPWENDATWQKHNTDARRFISCPTTWELRWLNPRRIQSAGLRDWSPVMAYDARVEVKFPAMISPEHYVRRGGRDGDILCFMPKHWVESRNRLKAREVERRTQKSIDLQQRAAEEINRGNFGPRIHVDSVTHPTHTTLSQDEMAEDTSHAVSPSGGR